MDFSKRDLKHNNLTHINNVNFVSKNLIAQGLTDNQRQGNEMYVSGVRLQLLLGQPSDRPNITFKTFLVEWKDRGGVEESRRSRGVEEE